MEKRDQREKMERHTGLNTKTKKKSHAKSLTCTKICYKRDFEFNYTKSKTLICELKKRKKHMGNLEIASKSFKVVKS